DALIPHSPPHFRAWRSLDDRSRCVSRRGLTRRDRRAMLPSQSPPIPAAEKQQVGGSSPLASSLNTSSDNGLMMGGTRRLAWKWIAAAHDPPACQWRPPTRGFQDGPTVYGGAWGSQPWESAGCHNRAKTGRSPLMPVLPNIVLVHGAWANGSSWNAVIERVQADGYRVTAPAFALTRLADDADRLRQILVRQNGPTLVAGHSYGGQIITALGTDTPNVVGLVYIAPFVLEGGAALGPLF